MPASRPQLELRIQLEEPHTSWDATPPDDPTVLKRAKDGSYVSPADAAAFLGEK